MSRDLTRRDFLARASAATLSALAAGFPRAIRAQNTEAITPTADTVIVFWMAGGMAHTETFDPKRYTPFEPGLNPSRCSARSRRSTPSWITSSSRRDWNASPA